MMLSEQVQSQWLNNSMSPQVNDNIPTEGFGRGDRCSFSLSVLTRPHANP